MDVETLIKHGGVTYAGDVCLITKTRLGMEDHGLWTAQLCVDMTGRGGTWLGGHCLDDKPTGDSRRRRGTAYGMDWIMSVCRVVGVENWEDLTRKRCYGLWEPNATHHGFSCLGIASIDGSDVLIFKDLADEHSL